MVASLPQTASTRGNGRPRPKSGGYPEAGPLSRSVEFFLLSWNQAVTRSPGSGLDAERWRTGLGREAGVGCGVGCDLFGGAGGYDLAAAAAALGAHVDDPVGGFDDVEIVLDDEEEPPPSMSLRKAARSLATSSKWRPVVGSSRM